MSLIELLCGPCMSDTKNIHSNVSTVTVVPTPDGTLVPVRPVGVTAGIPCMTNCTLVQALIVIDSGHDLCDPIGLCVPGRV